MYTCSLNVYNIASFLSALFLDDRSSTVYVAVYGITVCPRPLEREAAMASSVSSAGGVLPDVMSAKNTTERVSSVIRVAWQSR